MNKQYTTPEVNVIKVNSSTIICASLTFGDGETDIMHAREYAGGEDNLEAEDTHTSNSHLTI